MTLDYAHFPGQTVKFKECLQTSDILDGNPMTGRLLIFPSGTQSTGGAQAC